MMIFFSRNIMGLPNKIKLGLQKPQFSSNLKPKWNVGPTILKEVVSRHVVCESLNLLTCEGVPPMPSCRGDVQEARSQRCHDPEASQEQVDGSIHSSGNCKLQVRGTLQLHLEEMRPL